MYSNNIIYSSFLNATGYGQSARDYIFALHSLNKYNISLDCFGVLDKKPITEDQFSVLNRMKDNNLGSNSVKIFHCLPELQNRKSRCHANISLVVYETYDPPSYWTSILNKSNAVIVPSWFNYELLNHSGLKVPLYRIPHCLDFDKYNINVTPSNSYSEFTFLFFASWKDRKGGEELIEAYFEEFDKNDNVRLVLKTNVQKARKYVSQLQGRYKKKELPPISFENNILKDNDLPNFFKSFDCLVLPTKGEGFGLPVLQSLAVGVPVITTYFSGLKDIVNNDNAVLIEPEGLILKRQMDNYPQFANKKWAFVSVRSIREKMRYAYNNIEKEKRKAICDRDRLINQFSYDVVAKEMDKVLQSI